MSSNRRGVATASIEHRFERLKVIDTGVWDRGKNNGPGKGAMNGGIYLVRRKKDGKICVQKNIPPEPYLLREISILRKLHHPNICEYVDAFDSKEPPAAGLFMEYCDLGTIDGVIDKYHKQQASRNIPDTWRAIPEAFIWKTLFQLADALQYLHHGISFSSGSLTPAEGWRTILHRDVKPSNIFIKSSPNKPLSEYYPKLVLGDFGLAIQRTMEVKKEWEDVNFFVGTLPFQPPQSPEHSARGDVWSLGAVIQCMCRLEQDTLHPQPHGVDFNTWIRNVRSRLPKAIPSCYSEQLHDVLGCALEIQKEDRPFASALFTMARKAFKRTGVEFVEFVEFPKWVFEGKGLE